MIENEFPKQRTNGAQCFIAPEEGSVSECNPPIFIWLMPPCDKKVDVEYKVVMEREGGEIVWEKYTTGNSASADRTFLPGNYRWNVYAPSFGTERGWIAFTIDDSSVHFICPDAQKILDAVPMQHPRHLFSKADTETLLKRKETVEALRRNIEMAYADGLPERPMFHTDKNAPAYREYFGRFRDFCDRNLVACALGYSLFGDEKAGAFAKKLFLHICDWNPDGPCSLCGEWGDEVGLSCARVFPAVFDMLYPLFDNNQRLYAANAVIAYALQCEKRLTTINYAQNPGDSHTGRLPAYMGEAALSLWGEEGVDSKMLVRWIRKAVFIYGGVFPFYGSRDGGWAEGTFYSTSYTKWYLPFFSAVARYTKSEGFFAKPFYKNYARFLLHFALPDHELHPFGDGYWCRPDSEEWPGFFAQNPFRIYSSLSGIEEAQKLDRELSEQEFYSLHLLDLFLPDIKGCSKAKEPANADAFYDSGYISLHSDRNDKKNDLHLIAHATKFGPGSHRHPDQGSFALFYGGAALISPSGYFGYKYGTLHHMKWTNSAKAHNVILVDGEGQKRENFDHTGKFISCGEDTKERFAKADLSCAYPMLKTYIRKYLVKKNEAVIEDIIEAKKECIITLCLHSLSKPEYKDGQIVIEREGARLLVKVPNEIETVEISDRYDTDINEGVDDIHKVNMPIQYHIYLTTQKRKNHDIQLFFEIEKIK